MDNDPNKKQTGGKSWLSDIFNHPDIKGVARFASFFLILGALFTSCSIMDSVAERVSPDDKDRVQGTVPDCTTQKESAVVINNKAFTLTCR